MTHLKRLSLTPLVWFSQPGSVFLDSVRYYRDRVEDPKLKKEMSRFFGQEGMHSREHSKYNQMLCDLRGYNQEKMEGRTINMVRLGEKKMPRKAQLAATCPWRITNSCGYR